MIAKHLESFLSEAISQTDLAGRSPAEMVQRFQQLRGAALLPKGRGKNAQHLSPTEMVAGLLSVVPAKPGFAGLGSKILMDLRPVGGTNASFGQAATFGQAVELLLNESNAQQSLLEVRVSDSEVGVNTHCRAAIHFCSEGSEKIAHYVNGLVVSLSQTGAELTFDPRLPTMITETVFYPPFFRRLDREIQRAKLPAYQALLVDEEEDDVEKAKEERARRLGLVRGSRFLNVGIESQVIWASKEQLIDFENYKLVLMPPSREHAASVNIDLHKNGLTPEDASSLINRFLSLLTWCDDQFGYVQGGWSGNPVPMAVPKPNFGFSPTEHWLFNRKIPKSPEARKAIAIYREGRNAEQSHLVSYSVLAYYKIIELKYRGQNVKEWFRETYPKLRNISYLADTVARFESERGTKEPHDYIYRACRTAVAHANTPYSSDPDDFSELRRLHVAAEILRELARLFIRNELGLSDSAYDGT
jgi:Methylamine utilization protein MauJ